MTHDNNGNLTSLNANGSLTTLVFDRANRLAQEVSNANLVTTLTYRGDGLLRTKQISNGSRVTMLWDGINLLGEAAG